MRMTASLTPAPLSHSQPLNPDDTAYKRKGRALDGETRPFVGD